MIRPSEIYFLIGVVVGAVGMFGVMSTAHGQTWSGEFTTSSTMAFSEFKPSRTIVINNGSKSATIDFEGEAVKYSGDLPVDDAAKVFFDALMSHMRKCK